jgi:hypothetical protein
MLTSRRARPVRARVVVPLVAALVSLGPVGLGLVAGCGHDPSTGVSASGVSASGVSASGVSASGVSATGVSATDWAATVCTTLTPWRAKIAELNLDAKQRLAAARTPEQTRTELVALFTGAETATESARSTIAAAGIPAVAGGDEVARRFVASLQQARDAYAHAVAAIQAIAATDPAFYDRVADVLSTLTQEYDRSGVDTTALNSPDLTAAFAGLSQCQ